MFFEGAPRLRASGVTIPGLQQGDPDRICIEAYPGILARTLIGRRSNKQDTKAKQTAEQMKARSHLFVTLTNGAAQSLYGLRVSAPAELIRDPGGDHLDALPCAVQAAWAWGRRTDGFGAPEGFDRLQGWIADPALALCAPASAEDR